MRILKLGIVSLLTLIVLQSYTLAFVPQRVRLNDEVYQNMRCEVYYVDLNPWADVIIKYHFSKKHRVAVRVKVTDNFEGKIYSLKFDTMLRR